MSKLIFAAVAAALLLGTANAPAAVAAKKCPDGQYYDESKRKCVTRRGS